MNKEYIIENITSQEKQKLYESIEADYITWYPFNLLSSSSIVVDGTEEDFIRILTIIGRK